MRPEAAGRGAGKCESKHMPFLQVRGLIKDFGSLRALHQVGIELDQGEVLGIVGPNGSGKTTFLNLLSGYYRPSQGEILFRGKAISRMRSDQIATMGIVRTFQSNVLYGDATVVESVLRGCYLMAKTGLLQAFFNTRTYSAEEKGLAQRAAEIAALFDLEDVMEVPASLLPHGKQRALGIAMAFAAQPTVLLLDEPLAGMDFAQTQLVAQAIQRVIAEGMTVLLVEHNIPTLLSLCRRIMVLDSGRKIADGEPSDVINRREVVEAYLGMDDDV